jgi:hypothetical protein
MFHRTRSASLGMLAVLSATAAHAQSYRLQESFDSVGSVAPGQNGPSGLIQRGWIFRNQSSPGASTPAWAANGVAGFGLSGGYLSGTTTCAGQFANFSSWAILPDVPGLTAGDLFTLWVLDGAYGAVPTHIDIRRSPTGGTSTGSGPTGVGDFTEVLFTGELPLISGAFEYVPVQLTVPGPGRIAVRFHAPFVSNFPSFASLHLDELTIGDAPPPPCELVIPGPGETAVWTAAAGPYEICTSLSVPEGATLVIEAGSQVSFVHGHDLQIEGTLIVQGTASQPVVFDGDNVTGLDIRGDVEMTYAQIDCWVGFRDGGGASMTDCVLSADAWLGASTADTALTMLRCDVHSLVFSGAGADNYTDVRFLNPAGNVKLGRIARVTGVESVAPIEYTLNGQTRLIENVEVTGVAGPAIAIGSSQSGTADVILDGSNTLIGNEYPIYIRTSGLHPGSVIPTTGNIHNAVRAPIALGSTTDVRSLAALPNVGVPYHVLDDAQLSGRVDFAPGALFRLAPGAAIDNRNDNGSHPQIRGLPGNPIRFARLDPSQPWAVLSSTLGINLWEHLEIDGAGVGAAATGSYIHLRDCQVSGTGIGAKPGNRGIIYGSGNTFLNNEIGVHCDTSIEAWGSVSGIRFDGTERPNSFLGNTLAAYCPPNPLGPAAEDMEMQNNWWGDATGPHEPLFYPEGQGDPVHYPVLYNPWRTQPPMQSQRPIVRLITRLHPVALPGDRIFLEWDASDDVGITHFDIEMLVPPVIEEESYWMPLAMNLAGDTRRAEITVPQRPSGSPKQALFRIHAFDADGQIGLEYFVLLVPDQPPPGTVVFHTDLTQPLVYDGLSDLCYTAFQPEGGGFPKLYFDLDADMRTLYTRGIPLGDMTCIDAAVTMPMASTDRARFMIRFEGNNNDDYFYFSDYFSIRPDARLGDAPPSIQIVSPTAGQSFTGGGVIPIRWTASDDDFVREYRVQVSLNGGYTYHTVADRIPAPALGFDWRLPTSTGVSDVRIRAIAIDKRFQNSSSETIVSVLPGTGEECAADFTGDNAATVPDIFAFLALWFADNPAADFDGNGTIAIPDIFAFLSAWFAGC